MRNGADVFNFIYITFLRDLVSLFFVFLSVNLPVYIRIPNLVWTTQDLKPEFILSKTYFLTLYVDFNCLNKNLYNFVLSHKPSILVFINNMFFVPRHKLKHASVFPTPS